eukprot:scaffold63220_cov22-Tisochrysis_lutea.AAC.1
MGLFVEGVRSAIKQPSLNSKAHSFTGNSLALKRAQASFMYTNGPCIVGVVRHQAAGPYTRGAQLYWRFLHEGPV